MDEKKTKWRTVLLLVMMLVIMAVFCARLIQLQIVGAEQYEGAELPVDTYTIQTEAVRGEIFDANGLPLAVNETAYRVRINKLFMPESDLNDTICRLIDLTEECGDKWNDSLPILLGAGGIYFFDENKADEIEELKDKQHLNMNPYATAAECMAKLAENYGCTDLPAREKRNIVSVRYQMQKNGYSNSSPYTFAENISRRTMNVIAEAMQGVEGVSVESTAVRTYKNGTAAPHIVGVMGLMSEEDYRELKNRGYAYNDKVGKSGIEGVFERYLRGSPGGVTYEVGIDNQPALKDSTQAKPGASVYLTIDTRYQTAAQQALKEAVQEANDYAVSVGDEHMGADCKGAAMVMLNVKDFSVLCAANYPSYDVSEFYEDYTTLAADPGLPLFDRAFSGALAPGSTFKPLVASAALQEGFIKPDTKIDCEGVYTKNGLHLNCMWNHGILNMYEALRESCNVYFAETARLTGIRIIEKYARRCGLGVKTGIEINESSGTLAGPEYSREMGTEWYDSFVSFAGIGQSDNQFTPLQLATYAATIANNGTRLKTHVVSRIVSGTGEQVIYQAEPEIADEMGVDLKNIQAVQQGMYMAAQSYTPLEGFGIQIAGKTGTAENSGSDHANFICYAPYDNPEIAVAVMVEHGAKSFVAIHAARKLMEAYFADQSEPQEELDLID